MLSILVVVGIMLILGSLIVVGTGSLIGFFSILTVPIGLMMVIYGLVGLIVGMFVRPPRS